MQIFDVVIVGASFSGLTLAHHLPKHLRVLVIDQKPEAGSTVESTGLITQKTYEEFKSFIDIDASITNAISAICVVAPDFKNHFISTTERPWIYQTDTKRLIQDLANTVPANVQVRMRTSLKSLDDHAGRLRLEFVNGRGPEIIEARFCVGADGSRSTVAKHVPELDQHRRFLFGCERVLFGDILLGDQPAETIYHFWFGSFSLGYGGWLSPTFLADRPAFRIGLAKHARDRQEAQALLEKFIERLQAEGIIRLSDPALAPLCAFGGMIPIDGVLQRTAYKNILLIGDAAGYCGAFAADGIKGSVVSGKEAASLIDRYLQGDVRAPSQLHANMNRSNGLIDYYKRQLRYRRLWDRMKRDRTFEAMYRIIEKEKESFLNQFCDSKDTQRSLLRTVLKIKHLPALIRYGFFVLWDMIFPPRPQRS